VATTLTVGPPRRRRRRFGRGLAIAVVVVLVLLVGAVAVFSWIFSTQLLEPDRGGGPYDVEVRAVDRGRVVLQRDTETERPGIYGLQWEGGHAIIEDVLATDDDTVTRSVRRVQGRLAEGTKTNVTASVYEGNPRSALGIPYQRVSIRGEVGQMPAWQVGGGPGTWLIFVHGHGTSPKEGLRYVPALRRSGVPTLLITYRNDPGAPEADGGKLHLGQSEWQDLQAAVAFARGRGARRVVLFGSSMGGAIVTYFLRKSRLANVVEGTILDAPALSWTPILEHQAGKRGLPEFSVFPLEWAVELRTGVSFEELDELTHTGDFADMPILLSHGGEDATVPLSTSEEFARKLPRTVEFTRVPQAGHIESWNVDRTAFDARLRAFLERVEATK
jgi:uncharacterized protein